MTDREYAKEGYRRLFNEAMKEGEEEALSRELGKRDLFFFMIYILNFDFADNDWVFERCREVEAAPDGYLDLWSREHYKSTIITTALTLQEIIRDPEITVGIFSFNRPIAKGFLRAIKWQLEQNQKLKDLYPEVCYQDPKGEAPKWSEDDGIVVKRQGMPKEATVEAWGLVDGQPTSKHFKLLIYDDVVSKESVSTPEMIAKVTEAVSLSFNLGSVLGNRRRFIGTRYHYADTYQTLIERGAVIPRVYGATKDGTITGEPWFWSKELLAQKIRDMGPYVASCQLFNKPVQEGEEIFALEWIKYWVPQPASWRKFNIFILVDPANEKKESSDYTVMMVIGLGPDRNYYLIDMVRDRLNLKERASRLFRLHADYHPLAVGYEKYGMQADIQHMESEMGHRDYRFNIIPLGGNIKKEDRIKRLQPLFQQGRFYIPETLMRTDAKGHQRDYITEFIQEEYKQFPYMQHDDMLDCMARICDADLEATFPRAEADTEESWAGVPKDDAYSYDTYSYLEAK